MRYIYGIKQNGILLNDSVDFIQQQFPSALEVAKSTEILVFTIHKTIFLHGRYTTCLLY